MKNWLKDPLIHFVLLGAALFIGHGIWAKHVAKTEYKIEISKAEIERRIEIFVLENNRQPTEQDVLTLKSDFFEEQVLMNEAIRLGLNEDDTIISRRLVQKMRFMIEDRQLPKLPEITQLEAWFNDNTDKFTRQAARSFRHIYLKPTDGQDIDARALDIKSRLTEDDWRTISDSFVFLSQHEFWDRVTIASQFGNRFADTVFEIEPGAWSAPIKSSIGLHLVYVDEVRNTTLPEFAEIKDEVAQRWLEDETKATNRRSLAALLQQYEPVDVE